MKHLIAFLGYNLSRIQHPVYRQFVQTPFARRNASLIFQARPLEERELVHEVNELRRREGGLPCEITFHLCATLDNPTMGQQIIQTVTMIHRLYDCPTSVYCLLPDLDKCSDEAKKNAWKCLVSLNNGVTDYPNLQLMSHCFLYHDASQVSLATFLYHITQQSEALDEVSRYGFIGKVITSRRSDPTAVSIEFPSIFSSFNAAGINYPEEEVRYYIHQSYLNALLAYSRPSQNPVDMEHVNAHVEQIITTLPLSDEQIALLGESFIDLGQETRRPWQQVDEYWKECYDKALHDLEDVPREEWLRQLKSNMEIYYQTRFRDNGVEYFYQREKKHTTAYCQVLLSMLRESVMATMLQNPYPPETKHDLVLSIVNHLQQQTVAFAMKQNELREEIHRTEESFDSLSTAWDDMGFFDRMRGKDKAMYDQYCTLISRYYVIRTRLAGSDFAIKLLNELIPQVSALSSDTERLAQICQEIFDSSQRYLNNNPPSQLSRPFESQPVIDAAHAIRVDQEQLKQDYARFTRLLYASDSLLDSELLMQQLREELKADVDRYIVQRIHEGTMSPVLGVSVADRLASLYADRGGLATYLAELKNQTALSLKLKGEGGHNEQYLLIAPDAEGVGPHIRANEDSSLQMLHIITGISLAELEGFAGQRMFVEPSIF